MDSKDSGFITRRPGVQVPLSLQKIKSFNDLLVKWLFYFFRIFFPNFKTLNQPSNELL
jgi:hypothetical protein